MVRWYIRQHKTVKETHKESVGSWPSIVILEVLVTGKIFYLLFIYFFYPYANLAVQKDSWNCSFKRLWSFLVGMFHNTHCTHLFGLQPAVLRAQLHRGSPPGWFSVTDNVCDG